MARTNKYTSLNFNHIYDKKTTTTSSTTSSATASANSRSPSSSFSSNKSYSLSASSRLGHGGMLVLSRPSPKPVSLPSPTKAAPDPPRPESPEPTISLRPQGKTGPHSPTLQSFPSLEKEKDVNKIKEFGPPPGGVASGKSDKFVPPHLRPGYVPREKSVLPAAGGGAGGSGGGGGARHGNFRPGSGHGASSNRYLDRNDRPKSGGGYDRRMRSGGGGGGGTSGGELGVGEFHHRPRSGGGDRPSSTG